MQGHAYTTDTVEKPLLLPLAPSPSPLQRRNTSSSAIPIKSSPLGIPRVQLQRSYSTSQSKSPIDGRSTGLNTAVVDPVPCPPRSSVEEQRAESLAKLTRSQMSSPISFSPSSFSAAYLSSDDGFTSASALADQSSLASSGTAVGAMTPRPHITIVSREHGTLLRSASNFLHKELGEAALGRRPARQPLGGFMLPADNTAHRLWVALHDGVLLLKLLNSIFPSVATIDRRDVPSSKRENAAKALDICQTRLFLHPNDLFQIDDLVSGDPNGFLQVIRTILSVAQRIRPTSSPPLSPRRGPTRSSSTQLPEDSLSDTSFPPSSDPEASDSSYSPRQASERGATRKAMSVRRPTMRKAAISFAGDSPDAHQMKRQRFYGMDRRVSESAIDLVSIEEEADGGGKFRRGRHNEGTEAIGARKDAPLVSDEPVNVSAVLSDAAMSPSSRPEALAISRPSLISRAIATHDTTADRGSDFAAVRPRVRRSSASSTSSVPFPSSSDIIKPKAPIRSPSRPVHHRTASEVQVARHDNISQRSRAESLSSVSATEDGRLKRRSQSHSRHQITFNDGARQQTYQLGAQIGSGQFGSVYRALDTYLGRVVAVKRIKIMGRSEEEIEQVVHEVDVLRKVAHPCIVKYEGLVRTRACLNLVMEYVESSLLDALKTYGEFSESLAASYVTQTLEGLAHLHQRGVVHCDLKCANILVTKSGNIKIGDFGVSLNLNTSKIKPSTQEELIQGTPNWMAPEIIGLKGASKASDIWSLGCTILEMLTGKPPYSDLMTMAAMYQIVEKDMLIPPSVTPQLYDLLSSCFAKDPEQRPTADQLCGHEWLSMSHIASFKAQDSLPFFQRRQSHDPRYEIGSSGESTTPGLDYSGSSFESSSLNTHFGGPGSPLYSPSHFGADLPDRTQRASSSDDSSFSGQSPSSINKARRTTLDMIGKEPSLQRPVVSVSSVATRQHVFVQTSFGRTMDCRICQSPIKRKGKARLCEGCGVICHATCAASVDGSSICDLRAALAAFPSPLSPIATGSPAMDVPADGASTPSLALSPMSHRGQPMTPVASPASPLAFKNPFRSRKPTSEDVAAVEERKENVNPTSPSAFRKAHTARSLSTSAVPSKQQSSMEAVPKRRTRLSKADHSGECLIS